MKRLCWIAFSSIVLLLSVSAAHAQVSIYGTVASSDYGYAFNGNSDSFYGDYLGFGGGLTYNFPHEGTITLGIDLRDTVTPDTHGGNTGAASFRIGFISQERVCHPYVQVGLGYISAKVPASSFTVGAQTINTVAIAVGGGLDIRINPFVSIRAVELESTVGNSSSNSTATFSVSTGIVYHFLPAKK